MAETIFQSILKQSASTQMKSQKDSVDWLRKKAMEVNTVNQKSMIDTKDSFKRIVKLSETSVGKMYMFNYNPKTKDKLPYYDVYPLIIPIDYYKDGFMGINFHYLPPLLRAKLMDALYTTINNEKMDKTTKMRVSYQILKSSAKFKYFEPCVKRYLFSHVRSNFLYIAPDEWNIALMLPTHRFVKEVSGATSIVSAQKVYRDSTASVY